jgi:tripartite-type tricarboxylate transporter receptor subunit TctC
MVDLREHGTGIIKESAAGIGQFDAARLAAEQLGIDFAFDCPDLPTKRRRLQAEPLRGPRDVPFLSDRDEIAKLPQLHRPYLKGNDYGSALSWLDIPKKAIRLSLRLLLARELHRLAQRAELKEEVMKPTCALLLATLGLALGTPAEAQTWPAKPLRAIVPTEAGSIADLVPRVVFEPLSRQLGQSIIVENRTGVGGTIAAAFVAKSDADGYTFLVHSNAHTIAPALYPNLSYNPARDFAAVIPLGISPNVLVASPAKGFKKVGDLVVAGKAKPGSLTFASVGIGTATHLSAERFRASAGIEAVHVPFRGGPQAVVEVMAGRVDFFFGPVGLVLPYVREGNLVALAVNGAQRSTALPNVPTMVEAGFANAEYPIWLGIFLPVKTPRVIVDQLHRETLKALQGPQVREKLANLAVDPLIMTPAEFDAYIEKEVALNAALVKMAGLKPNDQ